MDQSDAPKWEPVILSQPINIKIQTALAKAQGEFVQPEKNKENPHFKNRYADLKNVIEAFRPHLSANGLSFTQSTVLPDGQKEWLLVLTLRHSSGEILETSMPINLYQTPQQVGSALTYLRRYQAATFFGIAADDDDDGNAASGKDSKPATEQKKKVETPAQKPETKPAPKETPQEKNPDDFVMPIGKDVKGKKLKDLSTPTLDSILIWADQELSKRPKAADLKQYLEISTNVKAVLKNRKLDEPPPPGPDDQGFPPEDTQYHQSPEDESQDRRRKNDPAVYKIPIDLPSGYTGRSLKGLELKSISERELKSIAFILDQSLKSSPPPVNVGSLIEINTQVKAFLRSMGVEP